MAVPSNRPSIPISGRTVVSHHSEWPSRVDLYSLFGRPSEYPLTYPTAYQMSWVPSCSDGGAAQRESATYPSIPRLGSEGTS